MFGLLYYIVYICQASIFVLPFGLGGIVLLISLLSYICCSPCHYSACHCYTYSVSSAIAVTVAVHCDCGTCLAPTVFSLDNYFRPCLYTCMLFESIIVLD